MLYRFQKEILFTIFIFITLYPSYKIFYRHKNDIKTAIKRQGELTHNLTKELIKEDTAKDTFKFNLNEVSWEALLVVPGIGEATAKKIIGYRLKNGKFKRLEDILKIKGIGRKTYEKLKPYVYVK